MFAAEVSERVPPPSLHGLVTFRFGPMGGGGDARQGYKCKGAAAGSAGMNNNKKRHFEHRARYSFDLSIFFYT